ncbi:MAG: hypothetical protein IKG86_01485 [Paludibacteraceae bacterium]|nr:hypothetical protein [Paludibacteraceae bacterium]
MNFQLFGNKEAPTLLLSLCPHAHIEVFPGMNHGQLLIDRPEEIAQRITKLLIQTAHKQ